MSFNWDREGSSHYGESLRGSIDKNFRPWAKLLAEDFQDRFSSLIVADIACGPGFLCTELGGLHPDCSFILVDKSEPMAEFAREEVNKAGLKAEIVICPADKLTIPDSSVDAVVCKQYFHDTDDPRAVIDEFFRILKPGGRTYLIDFDAESPKAPAMAIRMFLRMKANKRISDWYWKNFMRGKPGSAILENVKDAGFVDALKKRIGPNYYITATR